MYYVIVNKISGELEDDCGACSIGTIPDDEDLLIFPVPDNHTIVQITEEEYNEISLAIGNDYNNPTYLKKLDVDKAETRVEDRGKINRPHFAEMMGGREIVFTEAVPENIVKERGK